MARALLVGKAFWMTAGFVLGATVAGLSASAQSLNRPEDCQYRMCEENGYGCYLDPTSMSAEEAWQRVEQIDYRPYYFDDLLARATASGDPDFIQRLEAYARRRSGWPGNFTHVYEVLTAIRLLGAPRSFFWWRALDAERDPILATAAIEVLGQEPDSAELGVLDTIYPFPTPVNGIGAGLSGYSATLYQSQRVTFLPVNERARVLTYMSVGIAGATREWARSRLRLLYQEEPGIVDAAIAAYPSVPGVRPGEPPVPPPPGGTCYDDPAERIRQTLLDVAQAPPTLIPEPFPEPVIPPEDPGADVLPILECMDAVGAGELTAVFGYNNLTGEPVTVSHGASNEVTPASYHGLQPEIFDLPTLDPNDPGRTPPYPGFAWKVTFDSTETVTWTLPGGTAIASAFSPRCDGSEPDAPDLTTLPAAASISSATFDPRFQGTDFLLSGLDHDIDGNATGSGDDRHALAVPDLAAQIAAVVALDLNQHALLEGSGPSPDVAVEALPLDVNALADVLLARQGVIMLDSLQVDDLGSEGNPIVAYATGDEMGRDSLVVRGTMHGYGVLIVDGYVRFRRKATWHGLVIVRPGASTRAHLSMRKDGDIVGAAVVSSPSGEAVLRFNQKGTIRWSREALEMVQGLLDVP